MHATERKFDTRKCPQASRGRRDQTLLSAYHLRRRRGSSGVTTRAARLLARHNPARGGVRGMQVRRRPSVRRSAARRIAALPSPAPPATVPNTRPSRRGLDALVAHEAPRRALVSSLAVIEAL